MSRSTASSRPDRARTSESALVPHPHPSFEPCDLYLPGHLVHLIQAKKAWASDDPVTWGRYAGIEDGLIVVRFLDRVARFRNHRPQEIAAIATVGDKARVSQRWSVLSLHRRFEHVITVCIAAPDASWTPCSVASGPIGLSSPDDLVVRLEERGGFFVPASSLLGCLDEEVEPDPA